MRRLLSGAIGLVASLAGSAATAQMHDHSSHGAAATEVPPPADVQAEAAPSGTDQMPRFAPAPAAAPGLAADRYFDSQAMAKANRALRMEHGGMSASMVLFNLAEFQAVRGRDGYRWDAEAWFGGDVDRVTIKSEGEGSFARPPESGEAQLLYSHAIDPYWNLQGGLRQDFGSMARRTYLAIGLEGLAPYMFDAEATLFVSNRGALSARLTAWYDQQVTQSLVLQPRLEANLAAQQTRATGTGAGLANLEVGLRLRYEKVREFAPYAGVAWERRFGGTARLARANGEEAGGFRVVAGVRTWF